MVKKSSPHSASPLAQPVEVILLFTHDTSVSGHSRNTPFTFSIFFGMKGLVIPVNELLGHCADGPDVLLRVPGLHHHLVDGRAEGLPLLPLPRIDKNTLKSILPRNTVVTGTGCLEQALHHVKIM